MSLHLLITGGAFKAFFSTDLVPAVGHAVCRISFHCSTVVRTFLTAPRQQRKGLRKLALIDLKGGCRSLLTALFNLKRILTPLGTQMDTSGLAARQCLEWSKGGEEAKRNQCEELFAWRSWTDLVVRSTSGQWPGWLSHMAGRFNGGRFTVCGMLGPTKRQAWCNEGQARWRIAVIVGSAWESAADDCFWGGGREGTDWPKTEPWTFSFDFGPDAGSQIEPDRNLLVCSWWI